MSTNILYTTIAGWGVVSTKDTEIYRPFAFDNAAGTAILGVQNIAGFSTDEVGSQVYIRDFSGLEDGYYTLTQYFDFGATGGVGISGDPAKFSMVAGPATGYVRIEDHYKISTGIPDFVTGTNARARWYTGLTNITPSLSSKANIRGGIAKSDGITIEHNATYNGLDKIRWSTMNQSSSIQTSYRIWEPDELTGIRVRYGIPYMASYDNPDTTPSHGNYEPTMWGSEAIRVDLGTSIGDDEYELNMTRGLLRTVPDWHTYGELFFDGFTTPAGKPCFVDNIASDAGSYYESTFVFKGVITAVDYDNGVSTQVLEVSDDLLRTRQRSSAGDVLSSATWTLDDIQDDRVTILQKGRVHQWKWLKCNELCVRLSTSETDVRNFIDSTETNGRDEGYGFVKSTQGIISELRVDDQTINGVVVERLGSEDQWLALNRPLTFTAEVAGLGDDSPERERFLNSPDLIFRSEPDQGITNIPEGEPYIAMGRVKNKGYKIEPCHVFESNEFLPIQLWGSTSVLERQVGVNPVEVLLQIMLTRYGDSTNTFSYGGRDWDFDILTPELGLGIDVSDIEYEDFIQAGQFYDDNRMFLRNAYITADDSGKLSKWIEDNILKPYFLFLGVDNNGKIRLTRLTNSTYDTSLPVIDDSKLFEGTLDSSPVSLTYDTSALLDTITVKFDRPWIRPSDESSRKTFNFRYGLDGLTAQYQSLGISSVDIKPDFAFLLSDSEYETWANYYGRYLGNYRHVIPTVTCNVESAVDARVGSYVYIDLSGLPDSNGTTDGNLQGVALVIQRQKDVLYQVDQIKLAVIETTNLTPKRNFAASGEVASAASATTFDLETSSYVPADLSPYASDAASFQEGDQVLLYNERFTLLSFDGSGNPGPATIQTIAGDTITLTVAWTDNSLSTITPSAGDIMMLYNESSQTSGTGLNYMYVYTNRVDQYNWE